MAQVTGIKIPGIPGILKLKDWTHWVLYDTGFVPIAGQTFPTEYIFFATGASGSKTGGDGTGTATTKTRLDTNIPSQGILTKGWEFLVFSLGISFDHDITAQSMLLGVGFDANTALRSRQTFLDYTYVRLQIAQKDYAVAPADFFPGGKGLYGAMALGTGSSVVYDQKLVNHGMPTPAGQKVFQIPIPILEGENFQTVFEFPNGNPTQPLTNYQYQIRCWLEGIAARPVQ